MDDLTALPIEPSTFESADALLEHIKAKCEEFEAWAHAALAKAIEHTHAEPLGRLVGTLANTAKQIETMQEGRGVLFALEQPLLTLLDDFETRVLESVGSRVDALLGAHADKVQAMLQDTIRAPELEPEPEQHAPPAPALEQPPAPSSAPFEVAQDPPRELEPDVD